MNELQTRDDINPYYCTITIFYFIFEVKGVKESEKRRERVCVCERERVCVCV